MRSALLLTTLVLSLCLTLGSATLKDRGFFRGNIAADGATEKPGPSVLWMAPFLSGGGYSSEAISFIGALKDRLNVAIAQHGDSYSPAFVSGLPPATQATLKELIGKPLNPSKTVVVCHSEPGAWNVPKPLYQTTLCPPPNAVYAVGRTMFETDRITPGHVARCNLMDEIWVPTKFHVETFANSGVDRGKIFVIPEAVEVDLFDPNVVEPIDFQTLLETGVSIPEDHFKFLSVFKWEARKGWDILLKAYFLEFTKEDKVTLILKTNPYHTSRPFTEDIENFVTNEMSLTKEQQENLPKILLFDGYLDTSSLAGLYKAVDCFVLPSRGEGWGRPHVEAMAMELPVIATDWSGPQEFLNAENGYPLPLDGFTSIETGAFRGHNWANPSVSELRALMRHVMNNREEAKAKGKKAREDMVTKYRPEVVAQHIVDRLLEIEKLLPAKALAQAQAAPEREEL